ncbi:hypothetical protein PO124_23865 [Bacillus licheniformis]|nr:hypothetical protein [Bacillus licheniformis]
MLSPEAAYHQYGVAVKETALAPSLLIWKKQLKSEKESRRTSETMGFRNRQRRIRTVLDRRSQQHIGPASATASGSSKVTC